MRLPNDCFFFLARSLSACTRPWKSERFRTEHCAGQDVAWARLLFFGGRTRPRATSGARAISGRVSTQVPSGPHRILSADNRRIPAAVRLGVQQLHPSNRTLRRRPRQGWFTTVYCVYCTWNIVSYDTAWRRDDLSAQWLDRLVGQKDRRTGPSGPREAAGSSLRMKNHRHDDSRSSASVGWRRLRPRARHTSNVHFSISPDRIIVIITTTITIRCYVYALLCYYTEASFVCVRACGGRLRVQRLPLLTIRLDSSRLVFSNIGLVVNNIDNITQIILRY